MCQEHSPLAGKTTERALDWDRELSAHGNWLRKVILARTGEPQAVDDIFQQVALAAVEQRWPLADPAKAPAWLHRIAVVKSARYRRQQGRGRRVLSGLLHRHQALANDEERGLLTWLLRQERQLLVRQAIGRLAGRDAEILLLKYGERWTYQRIAERLGITEKAVDRRLERARQRLRNELAALGINEVET